MGQTRLTKDFYSLTTQQLARELLGKILVRVLPGGMTLRGIVVEVEAYLSHRDPASHSCHGLKKRNASMFMAPGTLYVYSIHAGYCMNVVSEPQGRGAAVLIRGVEPLCGQQQMALLRGFSLPTDQPARAALLTQGPGRLCQAFGVDRTLDGINLTTTNKIWFEEDAQLISRPWKARRSPRIGISNAQELKLRWFVDGNRYVSGRARDHSHGRNWTFQEPR